MVDVFHFFWGDLLCFSAFIAVLLAICCILELKSVMVSIGVCLLAFGSFWLLASGSGFIFLAFDRWLHMALAFCWVLVL